tara:strand:+ start:50 stop:370 length:321 start_codon:yes stop_codon:yes gene_type:complete
MIEVISNAIHNSMIFFLYLFSIGTIGGLSGLFFLTLGAAGMYLPLIKGGLILMIISITIIMIGTYIVNIFDLVSAVYNSRLLEHRKPALLILGLFFPPVTIYTLFF